MAGTSRPAMVGARAEDEPWGRSDTALFALATTTVVLLAAQFALAGFGAFTMVRAPTDDAYRAHLILGLTIGVMTWLILAAVAASRPARVRPRTWRRAAALALLAIPVEPLLGEAGTRVPLVGALHALNGLVICALAGWLMAETGRRRAAARRRAAGSGRGGDRR
jgi:cytochrome bd-type quinol oxidase subunit 1